MSQYILRKGQASLNDLIDGYAAVFAAARNVYHVDGGHSDAADGNEGLDPRKPMKTITACYGRLTTDIGDVMIIHGADYRYRESATLTILKDGITILGAGWGTEWNNPGLAGGYVLKVAAKAVKIANIQISVNDSGSGIYIGDNNDNKNAALGMIENCLIRGDWLTGTGPGAGVGKGIENDGASMMTVRNNHIWGWGTGIDMSDGAYRTAYGAHIYENMILTCQDYGIKWAGIGYASVIKGNVITDFSSTVQMLYGVYLDVTTGGVSVLDNDIAAANPVYDANDLNYWSGNRIRSTEALSETQALGQCAIDAVVDTD